MLRARVLFVCNEHGARSRIAERFAREDARELIEASSAAFDPKRIGGGPPIEAMAEVEMKFPSEAVPSVFDLYREGRTYDYVVTMCREATSATCPEFQRSVNAMFKQEAVRLAWEVPDFKTLEGSDEERQAEARRIRDQIRELVGRLRERIRANLKPGEEDDA